MENNEKKISTSKIMILFTGLLFGSCHVISTYSTLSDLLFIVELVI